MKSRTRGPRHLNLGLTRGGQPAENPTQAPDRGRLSLEANEALEAEAAAVPADAVSDSQPVSPPADSRFPTVTLLTESYSAINEAMFTKGAVMKAPAPTSPLAATSADNKASGNTDSGNATSEDSDFVETGTAEAFDAATTALSEDTFTDSLTPLPLTSETRMIDPAPKDVPDRDDRTQTAGTEDTDTAPSSTEAIAETAYEASDEAVSEATPAPATVQIEIATETWAADTTTGADRDVDDLFVEASNAPASHEPIEITSVTAPDDTRIEEPVLTPPPRTRAPAVAESTGKQKSKSRAASAATASTPARTGSRAVVKARPGTILQLSNASPVTYWGTTGLMSLTWVAGLVASSIASEAGLAVVAFTPFKVALLALLAVLPLGLIFATAYALRHASRLAIESARAAAMADSLVAPAAAAAADTATLVATLREQVEQAVAAVRQAQAEMSEMGQKLQSQSQTLNAAAEAAQSTTQRITGALSEERQAIVRIGESLDAQTQGVISAFDRQVRMVADASELAQNQLLEAEAQLTNRTADLSGAVMAVRDTARIVAEDLDRQTQRLESAGAGVADQIKIVEDGLSQQRAGLVSATLSLRADQEDFAVLVETQRAKLADALSVTRTAMVELGDASSGGIDTLRNVVLAAQEQLQNMLGAAEHERTAFETRIHSTLSNISVMAADARDELINETQSALAALNVAAEDSRKAADSAAASAQARVERLNETLFDAGKKADEIFDTRMNAARQLIEDSAALIDDAGARTQSRLDEGFLKTRDTVREVTEALEALNTNAESLPAFAQARIAEIRQSVEDGIRAMTEAARQAAQETEAVDQSFQDRVRRNYDMLSEAVRMMGLLSGNTPSGTGAVRDRPRVPDVRPEIRPEIRQEPARPQAPEYPQAPRDVPRETPRAETPRQAEPERPRRNPLSEPFAQSQPAKSVPPQLNTPPSGRSGDNWSWSDLLKGIGPESERAPDQGYESLDEMMVGEIAGMGIDAASLLGRTRMDETIAAILAEDNEGARLAVRRIAPAAVRRLTRRFVSDTRIRDLASQFIAFYDREINKALMSNDARTRLHEILANDNGRAYLLIDAAISDII